MKEGLYNDKKLKKIGRFKWFENVKRLRSDFLTKTYLNFLNNSI